MADAFIDALIAGRDPSTKKNRPAINIAGLFCHIWLKSLAVFLFLQRKTHSYEEK